MQIKDVEKLKQWLHRKLEPLCDADPAALSKYVVALLRKDKPKALLRELCVDQLEVFLAKETTSFVDRLFRGLESEIYLKGEDAKTPPPSPPPNTKTSSPPSSQDRTRMADRRQSEDVRIKEVDEEDRDFRRAKRTPNTDSSSYKSTPTSSTTSVAASSSNDYKRGPVGGHDHEAEPRAPKKRKLEPESSTSSSSSPRVTAPINSSGSGSSTTASSGAGSGRKRTERPEKSERSEGSERNERVEKSDRNDQDGVGGGGSGRRPVRERLGVRSEERSDSRGRWLKPGRSHSSGSDSDSSTGSSSEGRARKRPRVVPNTASRKTQRCKNYDERGFCMLGEQCPYDHGSDPVVVNPYTPPLPLRRLPPMPPLPKPGMLVPPVLPHPLSGRASPSNSSTDGYNPEEPGLTASSSVPAFLPTPLIPPPLPIRPTFPPPPLPGITIPPPPPLTALPPPLHIPTSLSSHISHLPRTFLHGPRPPLKVSDTLVIKKIPRELNSITKLSSHFEKFGTIVNLTVRYERDPEGALVQFSTPWEARRAYESTEAVLNNRFIRIYYLYKDHPFSIPRLVETSFETPESVAVAAIHGPTQFQAPPTAPPTSSGGRTTGVLASQTLETEKEEKKNQTLLHPATIPQPHSHPPTTATLTITTTKPPPGTPPTPTLPPSTQKPLHSTTHSLVNVDTVQKQRQSQQKANASDVARKKLELHKRTWALLEKQIQQQKLLLAKLEKSGKNLSAEEKNRILQALKSLSGSISMLKDTAAKTMKSKQEVTQLKKEWESDQTKVGVAGGGASSISNLKEEAKALRKQAHMMGLLSSPNQPLPQATTTTTTTTTTGSGRGHQPADVPPTGDLRSRLDSKPRRLLVMNVQEREQLTSYFESFGGLMQVEVDSENPKNLIFTFRNNFTAQKVVRSGSTFNGKPLIMKWYTPKAPPYKPPSPHTPLPIPSPTHTLPMAPLNTTTKNHPVVPSTSEEQVPPPTTPTLVKLDPTELHLVDDDDEEEESEGRSWRL